MPADRQRVKASKETVKQMDKTKDTKKQETNGNGSNAPKTAPCSQKEPKAYKSVMKAFEMTHKRLYPELYKEKVKRG